LGGVPVTSGYVHVNKRQTLIVGWKGPGVIMVECHDAIVVCYVVTTTSQACLERAFVRAGVFGTLRHLRCAIDDGAGTYGDIGRVVVVGLSESTNCRRHRHPRHRSGWVTMLMTIACLDSQKIGSLRECDLPGPGVTRRCFLKRYF
jgi:hypothetical protein